MEAHVFAVVLLAALFHATWNAFVKVDGDRLLFFAVMLTAGGLAALATLPFLPLPARESWPYILLSVLVHQGYSAFLLLAYRYGDLSHVYPLARGSAPLIVALVSVTVIGEALSPMGLSAVAVIGLGIMSLALTRDAQGLRDPWSVLCALATGGFIAGYTVIDGIGARAAGNAHAYAAWMLGLEWIPVAAFAFWIRRRSAGPHLRRIWKRASLLGVMGLIAYWAVIWAMTVAPIALVAALRETSIVMVVIFGVVFLKERLSLVRLAATMATLIGTVMLKLSRP
ncbi:MAG: DMT family transporter [Pseudomonadota bacterium]